MHIVLTAIAAPAPDRAHLVCPVCDSHNVVLDHLDCRALGPLGGEVQLGRDGLHVDPAIPDPEGGATVGLRCACDRGHVFTLRFRQLRQGTIVERHCLPWTRDPAAAGEEN